MSNDFQTQFQNHMTLQRFSHHTMKNYMAAVKGLADYYGKSPDLIEDDEIEDYFRFLIHGHKLAWSSCNNHFTGISCFYKNVLKRERITFKCPPRTRQRKLPVILSEEEVKRLFEATTRLKDRVFLKTVYSAGLRASEVIKLKPIHIESDPSRMMIRIEQGKGRKDRYTLLSRHLLPELREYYRKYRPGQWLFPGSNKKDPITYSGARKIFMRAKKKPV